MISLEEAFGRVVKAAKPLSSETIALTEAAGRVLSQDIRARRTQPAANLSAMDGYALSSADLEKGLTRFKIISEAPAGTQAIQSISSGQAVKLYTGSVIPDGADQVIMQEHVDLLHDEDGAPFFSCQEAARVGAHIRPEGADFFAGQVLMAAGRMIMPKNIALLAAGGHDHVTVHRAPRLMIITTGKEIVKADQADFLPSQTVDSVSPMLQAFFKEAGALIVGTVHVGDDEEALAKTLEAGFQEADITITIGGASVGAHDPVKRALETAKAQLDFWRIAMQPGKPFIFARSPRKLPTPKGHRPPMGPEALMIGLPGNAVSAFVCSLLLVRPLIDHMLGRPAPFPRHIDLPLAHDIKVNGERAHFMRARLSGEPGQRVIEVAAEQDSSLVRILSESDGLVWRRPHADALKAGDLASFIPF